MISLVSLGLLQEHVIAALTYVQETRVGLEPRWRPSLIRLHSTHGSLCHSDPVKLLVLNVGINEEETIVKHHIVFWRPALGQGSLVLHPLLVRDGSGGVLGL